MFACIHTPDAGALASSFSPWVEIIDETTAVFALTPRQLAERTWERIPVEQEGARVAVASTVEAAILAAHHLPGCTFLAPGDEARVLGELPIDCLANNAPGRDREGAVLLDIFETLDSWGVHTLTDLGRLPEADLAARLGERGVWLQRMARGALSRPLRPATPATTYEESAEFDHPIELREPLQFVIARFLHALTARMRAQSLAAQAVRLTLGQHKRTLGLPFPTLDIKLLLKLVEHSLDRQPPEAPIERVHLELEPTRPRRVQHGLFTPAAPEPEKLELTLGKIRALVGERNVGYPELFDTHRPGAGKPLAFVTPLAFRYFRPPLAARVETEAERPKHLWTKTFYGRVAQAAGPWRTSGDWWCSGDSVGQAGSLRRVVNPPHETTSWSRDEWDLLLDGALYRLYLDHASQQWFVEGVYD
jgi:protein ImuB